MDENYRDRLIELLRKMRGESGSEQVISWRTLARNLDIPQSTLQSYVAGDKLPEIEQREKIAKGLKWTREELDAYLEDRILEPTKSIDEICWEIRTVRDIDDLERIARVTLAQLTRMAKSL